MNYLPSCWLVSTYHHPDDRSYVYGFLFSDEEDTPVPDAVVEQFTASTDPQPGPSADPQPGPYEDSQTGPSRVKRRKKV